MLIVNERKLMEFQPVEQTIAISVFWRHREIDIMHAGRLSDIYLLMEGFWKHFDVHAWEDFQSTRSPILSKLLDQLVFLMEEFRLMELIQKKRIGTVKLFKVRIQTYLAFHKQQLSINSQKGFLADAFFNYVFIGMYEGTMHVNGPRDFDRLTFYYSKSI